MADDLNHKTISKSNAGFPGYLDFDKLRSSSIEYLGKLSGKLWTDHNVHDPGITILEVLIYALLDLGYRTNLPVADMFTRNPEDTSRDDNFFTPAQILGNNPLTITDYRKMLVDISGIKNAWLEVDEDTPVNFCKPKTGRIPQTNTDTKGQDQNQEEDQAHPCDCDKLNGLYHVYLQLETDAARNKHKTDAAISKARRALMEHRNLCEDYVDIKVLCSLEIGLCMEVELGRDADVESVYLKIVEVLQEYFSPSPRFYSLQQLLDKDKSIDEIFAGRPFNTIESHGFIDTEEFEQLTFRKELHLSDVYHILAEIDGISNVRNLAWISCCDDKASVLQWKLQLPENYVPEFSTACSGFTFTRAGLPVKVDLKKFDSMIGLQQSAQHKALYASDSPYLNPESPKGVYRSDLADYYSIQNDFPQVYGIREGSLGKDASSKRQAQALQLQGFLLFFDQLLANYLTQLKNMRSLFSMSSSKIEGDNHTYFINQLTNAPQLNQLLRFRNTEDADSNLGTAGSILAYPTGRQELERLIEQIKSEDTDPEQNCKAADKSFPGHSFCFAAERDQAIHQLKDDLLIGDYQPVIAASKNGHYFFYIPTSSPEFVLVSKRYYKDPKEAANAAASVKYIGTFHENFRSFIATSAGTNAERFSFDIDFNLDSYANYLQLIVEDKALYATRRQDFLDHLLSRFAERFTDFAMLSEPFSSAAELKDRQIKAEEQFLGHYDDISRNRGKAFDYRKDKWWNHNISGFERRVKALSGIENWRRHYLCNFVVEKTDKLYRLLIPLFDQAFTVENKTVQENEALASYHSLYEKLSQPEFDLHYVPHESKWQVYISDDFSNKYSTPQLFSKTEQAETFRQRLTSVFNFQPDRPRDVFVSKYIHKNIFTDHASTILAESKQHFTDQDHADEYNQKFADSLSSRLKKPNDFLTQDEKILPEKLLTVSNISNKSKGERSRFIDESQFVFKDADAIVLTQVQKKFSALNKNKTFQFDSTDKYADSKAARAGFRNLLVLLTSADHYVVEENKQTQGYEISIKDQDTKTAVYYDSFPTAEAAENKKKEILAEINTYTYNLYSTEPIPDEWEFRYRSEDLRGTSITYESREHYKSEEAAWKATQEFYANIPALQLRLADTNLILTLDTTQSKTECAAINPGVSLEEAKTILEYSQALYEKVKRPKEENFIYLLETNRVNPGEDYVYKLVDRDNLTAYHPAKLYPKAEAEKIKNDLIARATAGYDCENIVLTGNIIRERKDPKTKAVWYHFQLKCSNRRYQTGSLAGQELVLFESTRGYASFEEARTAFKETYLLVLKYARLEKNYGVEQFISLVEILVHMQDACLSTKSVVFIPKETWDEFGGQQVPKELILLASGYPIQYLRKNKYRFALSHPDHQKKTVEIDWISKKRYETAAEAMQQFRFFLFLLKHPGNFHIEWDQQQCGFGIYIREILAVSAHGFESCEEAWGKDGIEKFICIAQNKSGLHNYVDADDNYRFIAACGNVGLIHPCVYDTHRRRDEAQKKLYKSADFDFFQRIAGVNPGEIMLNGHDDKPLARIFTTTALEFGINSCEWLIRVKELAADDNNYIQSGNTFQLRRYKGQAGEGLFEKIAESTSTELTFKEWKLQLQQLAGYFPIVERDNPCDPTGPKKYFVEIRLPEPGENQESVIADNPYPPDEDCPVSCDIAWKSDCCFDTCCDALDFYIRSLLLLRDYSNYKSVNDCECGSYRIALYPQWTLQGKDDFIKRSEELIKKLNVICPRDTGGKQDRQITTQGITNELTCANEVVALSPQAYANDQMACDAIRRAKCLINSEGLHLVEHILLRPRCKYGDEDEGRAGEYIDCQCEGHPKPCVDGSSICHFEWKPGGEIEPCDENETVCFTPGCDPYSFISTVAMPAWPERFRIPAGRKIVEKLLQREAPAHVLLRILWLNPRDLCCFEHYFRQWHEWLAQRTCENRVYSNCDFLYFLFRKKHEGLADCHECQPCSCGDDADASCFKPQNDDQDDPCKDFTQADTLNKLFCWSQNTGYEYENCESCGDQIPADSRTATGLMSAQLIEALPDAIAKNHADAIEGPAPIATFTAPRQADPDHAFVEPANVDAMHGDELANATETGEETPAADADGTELTVAPVGPETEKVALAVDTKEGTMPGEEPAATAESGEETHAFSSETIEGPAVTAEPALQHDEKDKVMFVRGRSKTYEDNIRQVAAANPENEVAKKAMIFLKKVPSPAQLSDLIEEILRDKTNKAQNKKGLKKADKQIVIQNMILKYLDLVCFNGAEMEKITELKDAFRSLRKHDIDTGALYKAWDGEKVKEYEPSVDLDKIKNSLRS